LYVGVEKETRQVLPQLPVQDLEAVVPFFAVLETARKEQQRKWSLAGTFEEAHGRADQTGIEEHILLLTATASGHGRYRNSSKRTARTAFLETLPVSLSL
jgi:hypothetical protein